MLIYLPSDVFAILNNFVSRSQWPRGITRGSAADRLLGLRVRTSPGALMFFSYECCMFYRYRPLRRADPSSRGTLPSVYASLSVIRCGSNPLHLHWVGGRSQTKKKNCMVFPHARIWCVPVQCRLWETGYISLQNLILWIVPLKLFFPPPNSPPPPFTPV